MKRLAAILLSALILFSFTACDFFVNSPKESESNITANINESSSVSSSQEFIKYETAKDNEPSLSKIPEEYNDVINAFVEIANYQRYGNTASIDRDNYPNVSDRCYNAIENSIYESSSSVYGYF